MIRLPNIKSKAKFIILAVLSILTAVLLSVNIRQVTVSGNSQYTGNEIVELIFQKNMDWNSQAVPIVQTQDITMTELLNL